MRVKYSPDFKTLYDKLPPSIKRQFHIIDGQIASGSREPDSRMGWAYYVNINDHYAAMGSYPERDVFYWIWIGSTATKPIIF